MAKGRGADINVPPVEAMLPGVGLLLRLVDPLEVLLVSTVTGALLVLELPVLEAAS